MNSSAVNHTFFVSNQKYLNWFAFFSVFPVIKIAGISITFYIFIIIAFKFMEQKKKLFKITDYVDILLLFFLLFVLIAGFLTEESYRDRSLFDIIKLMFRYTYWVIIALFIKTWIQHFDFYQLSRSIFFATVASILYYKFINPFHFVLNPNTLAYIVVTAMPVGFYYVMKRFSLWTILFIAAGFVMGVLFTGSRTGTALTIMELLVLLSLENKKLKKAALILGGLLVPIILVFSISIDRFETQNMKYTLANLLEDYSPKIAHTLRMEENILERDKSWLIRELMIQKGEHIFEEHPFFGVGPGNFTKYYTPLDIAGVSHWLKRTEASYNTTSSQNSYLLFLAEDGIFALTSIVVVFLIIIWKGLYSIVIFKKTSDLYIYVPFIALLFYSVILVTTSGTLFWLFFGFALTLKERKRHFI